MNQTRFSKLVYIVLMVVLAACQARTMTPAISNTTVSTSSPAIPTAAKVLAEFNMNMPEGFAFGFDSVWVVSHSSPNVATRINPVSNKVIAVITGDGFFPGQGLVTNASVWVAGSAGGSLAQIDPKTNTIGAKVTGEHRRIAYGFNSIWAVGRQGDPLERIDPATNKIIASIPLNGSVSDSTTNDTVQVANSSVWVMTNDELIGIDPTTNSIKLKTTIDKAVAEAEAQTKVPSGKGTDFIWMIVTDGLLRIDPDTGVGLSFLWMNPEQGHGSPDYYSTRESSYFYPVTAVTDDSVWVAGYGQINRINIATNRIDATYTTHDKGEAIIGLGFGSVWVAYRETSLVQRLDITP